MLGNAGRALAAVAGKRGLMLATRRSAPWTVSAASQAKVFAPAAQRCMSSTSKLSGFLQVEVEEAKEGTDNSVTIESLLGSSVFKLNTEQSKGSYVVLNNGNATIEFECRDIEQDDQEGSLAVPFEVVISKGSKELIFDCIAQNGPDDNPQLLLESVTVQEASANTEDGSYSPAFPELDDNLQESFFDYLHDHGLDVDLAQNIVRIADLKESQLYLNWLVSVQKFVDTK